MTWRGAKALLRLRADVNIKWPKRSKVSDGLLGDASHSARESDHNPNSAGVVCAIDITNDPAHGLLSEQLAQALVAARDPRLKYCLAPQSRVLKADLTWVSIGDIGVGDRLVAFDEYGEFKPWHRSHKNNRCTAGQKMRSATVEAREVHSLECFEVSTDRATIVASADHLWLGAPGERRSYREWIETSELRVGEALPFFAEPWGQEDSFDAGWLAGLFDGEGCLSLLPTGGWSLSLAQREGAILDKAIDLLDQFCIPHEVYENGPVQSIVVRGGLPGVLACLGKIRSVRLTDKAISEQIWVGKRLNGAWERDTVREVRPLGKREVVALQTSTRTLIAEGLFHHNCISNKKICSGTGQKEPAWVWRPYTGINPHNHHVHISVKGDAAHYDNGTPWDLSKVDVAPLPPKTLVIVRPTLRFGDRGEAVKNLQSLLSIKQDGDFGTETEGAVKAAQAHAKVVADGVVGPYTWEALLKVAVA